MLEEMTVRKSCDNGSMYSLRYAMNAFNGRFGLIRSSRALRRSVRED